MSKYICIVLVALISIAAVAQVKKAPASAGGGREVVVAKDAPKAVGPYSQGVKAGGFIFTGGTTAPRSDKRPS